MTDLKRLFDAEEVAEKILSSTREKAIVLLDTSEAESRLKSEMDARAKEDSKKLFEKLVQKKVREIKKEMKTKKTKLSFRFLESKNKVQKLSKTLAKDLVKSYE